MEPGVEGLNVAFRLLLHLIPYARFEKEQFCPVEMTQRGTAARLGVGRPFISKQLKILVGRGLVAHALKHPFGSRRNEKAYFLTVAGMGLAIGLRRAIEVRAEAMAGGEERWDAPRMRPPARAVAAGA